MGPAMPLPRIAGLRSSRPTIRRRPAPQPGEPGNPQKPTWLCDHVLQQINRQKQVEQTAGLSEDSLHETVVRVGCRHASPVRRTAATWQYPRLNSLVARDRLPQSPALTAPRPKATRDEPRLQAASFFPLHNVQDPAPDIEPAPKQHASSPRGPTQNPV